MDVPLLVKYQVNLFTNHIHLIICRSNIVFVSFIGNFHHSIDTLDYTCPRKYAFVVVFLFIIVD